MIQALVVRSTNRTYLGCQQCIFRRGGVSNTRPYSYRRRYPGKKAPTQEQSQRPSPSSTQTQKELPPSPPSSSTSWWWKAFLPNHFYEKANAAAPRMALFVLILGVFSLDEKLAPVSLIRIHGPSMLPTLMPDGSEILLCSNNFLYYLYFVRPLQRGDLIGLAHADFPQHVSCKRVVGLPGDTVYRYGEYVHLYIQQDPENWGISPIPDDDVHAWMRQRQQQQQNQTTKWDTQQQPQHNIRHPKQSIVVPKDHVWVEADCPGLGIDSRHFGPVPMSYVRGKVIAKLWPIKSRHDNNWRQRPHPIPLDKETLLEYNLYRM